MKCHKCQAKISINYGDSSQILCSNCEYVNSSALIGTSKQQDKFDTQISVPLALHYVGWIVIILGFIVMGINAVSVGKFLYGLKSLIALWPGIVICISGLLILAVGKITTSVIKTANNSEKLVLLMQHKAADDV